MDRIDHNSTESNSDTVPNQGRRNFMKAFGVLGAGAVLQGNPDRLGLPEASIENQHPSNDQLAEDIRNVSDLLGYLYLNQPIATEITGKTQNLILIGATTNDEAQQIGAPLPRPEQFTPTELITQAATSRFLETHQDRRELFERVTFTPEKRDVRLVTGPNTMYHPITGNKYREVAVSFASDELDVDPYTDQPDTPSFPLGRPDVNLVYNFLNDPNETISVSLDTSTYLRTANRSGQLILSCDTGVTFTSFDGETYTPMNLPAENIDRILRGVETGWVINVPHNTAFSVMALPFLDAE